MFYVFKKWCILYLYAFKTEKLKCDLLEFNFKSVDNVEGVFFSLLECANWPH